MDPPACVAYRPGWVPEPDPLLSRLRQELVWEQHDVTLFGRTVPTPRLTAWLGDDAYAYSGVVNQPQPWPPLLADLRERLAEEVGATFNSCLANLYRDGSDLMGWHRDDEPELGPHPVIASVSLGERRTFVLRHRTTRQTWRWPLGHGDLLVMRAESQADYEHAVPKARRPLGPRLNLTFRVLRPDRR